VLAYDDDGLQSTPQIVRLTPTDPNSAITQGRLLGLCIGVSQYAQEKLNLRYAHADAISLAQALIAQTGYASAQAEKLTDANATRENVLQYLDNLVQRASAQDTVVLLFAGHGWRDEKGEFYFATHDLDSQDIAHTALSWREVAERLRQLAGKSKRVIVLLDACRSGSAASNDELIRALETARTGVLVFAASSGLTESKEDEKWGHGAFTKAILDALEGQTTLDEKGLSVLDFITYVQRSVKAMTEQKQKPTVPNLFGFDDMPLFFPATHIGANSHDKELVVPKKPAVQQPLDETINIAELKPRANELELMADIRDANNVTSMLTLLVSSISPRPGSLMENLPKAKKQSVLLTESTIIARRDKGATPLQFRELRKNDRIKIVGEMLPDSQIIKARYIWVYE
jgi:hypothetical protein